MQNVLNKLLLFQNKVGSVVKDSENPFFKSKYANINKFIETVKPILNEVQLVVVQPLDNINGKMAIKTIIADPESGETIETTTPITEGTDPQKQGSAISYFRRYALQSALLLETADDDDGEDAKQNLTEGLLEQLEDYIVRKSIDESPVLKAYGVRSLKEMSGAMLDDCYKKLTKKYGE